MFELQCLALRKDCEMYKDRIAAVLQQMEEVASERDQVGATSHLPGRLRARARQGSLPGRVASRAGGFRGGQLSECLFFLFIKFSYLF